MHRYRRTQIVTICALVVAIVTLGVGFAAFSTTLNISSSASVTPNSGDFNVGFYTGTTFNNYEEMIYVKTYNGAEQPTVYITNGTDEISGFSPYFSDRGQYVEYLFNIGNNGMYDAYLKEISFKDFDNGSNKKCSGNGWSTESLVQQACEGISVSISVDSKEITSTTSLNNIAISPGEFLPVVVTISYASDAVLTDGAFSVSFGDLVLDYSTVQSTSNLISFTMDGITYQAEEGMTWSEWYLSDHFTLDRNYFFVDGGVVCTSASKVVYDDGSTFVGEDDQIIDGHNYGYKSYGVPPAPGAFEGQ